MKSAKSATAHAAKLPATVAKGLSSALRHGDSVWRRRRVERLPPDELEQVRALFDSCDSLKRGRIDAVELRAAVDSLSGRWLSEDELVELWPSESASDTLGFDEFLQLVGPEMFPSRGALVLRAAAHRATELARPVVELLEAKARDAAAALTEAAVSRVLSAAEAAVLEDALDPAMPAVLRAAQERALRLVFEDVEREVRAQLLGLVRAPAPLPDRSPRWWRCGAGGCGPLGRARAWLLHTLYPHDGSVWSLLRSPAYVLLRLASLVPYWGVQPLCSLALFALLDRGDEYQLVRFILEFKGTQFVSLGLVSTATGAALYVARGCAAEPSAQSVWEYGLFLAQVAAVWAAFLLLRCSRPTGGALRLAAGQPGTAEAEGSRGGRLRHLVLWDVACAGLAVGLLAWAAAAGLPAARVLQLAYWARAGYGLLALPFLPFVLPVVGGVLTHARPTGYDRAGSCVPLLRLAERAMVRAEQRRALERKGVERELRGRRRRGPAAAAAAAAEAERRQGADGVLNA